MSKLQLSGRPWVVFDAENFEHRQYYFEFIKNNTWGKCPVRFILPNEYSDLLTFIQKKITDFYIQREFGFLK